MIVTFVTLLQIDLFVLIPLYLFTLKSFLPLTFVLKFKYMDFDFVYLFTICAFHSSVCLKHAVPTE